MGLVYGKLTRRSDGTPIAGVRLRFKQNGVIKYNPLTDANGNYCISSAVSAQYTVTATTADDLCTPTIVNVPAGSVMVNFVDEERGALPLIDELPDGTVEAPLRVFWYYPDADNPPNSNKLPAAIKKAPKGTYACAVQVAKWKVKAYLDDQVEKDTDASDVLLVVWNLKEQTAALDLSGDGWICATKKGKSAPKKPAAKKAAPKKAAAKKK